MNQHLQKILDLIQQSEHLSAEEKTALLQSAKDADKEFEITTFKLDRTEKVKRTTAILLEETIEELEQKRKAVEQQNKELEIESALERVRTVAMGMKKADELLSICEVLYKELQKLGFSDLRNAMINIHNDEKESFRNYDFSDFAGAVIADVKYNIYHSVKTLVEQARNSKDAFIEYVYTGNELEDWKQFRKQGGEYDDPRVENITSLYYYFYSIGVGSIGISTFVAIGGEKLELLKRFRNVFDLAYRRYVDITKAEAQAREAEIELALERVRARTMAMQHSDELPETAQILFQQFKELGEDPIQITIGIFNEAEKIIEFNATDWAGSGMQVNRIFKGGIDEPILLNKVYRAWKDQKKSVTIDLAGQELQDWAKYRNQISGIEDKIAPLDGKRTVIAGFFSKGLISISSKEKPPTETIQVIERFAQVFDQTYTRFLDLQKAEAQAREAKIEVALERTRTQSMIMQHSKELDDTLRVFHEQVLLLGIHSAFSFLWLPDEDKGRHIFWAAWKENNSFKSKAINYPLDRNEPATAQCLVDWKSDEPVHSYHVKPADVDNYFAAWKELLAGVEKLKPEYFPDGLYYVEAFMKYGCFGVMIENEMPGEEKKLLNRFAIEFERTYTRFLDLQKAEAQAREAEIELALERVRARTMAMQQSNELPEAANLLFQQVQSLGMPAWSAGYCTWDDDKKNSVTLWMSSEGVLQPPFRSPTTKDELFIQMRKGQEEGKTFHVVEMGGKKLVKHYQYMRTLPLMGDILDSIIAAGHPLPTFQIMHHAYFSKGFLLFITYQPVPYAHDIFKRFGKVFDQTYTRFLDLQKAEAQAREAQIETALERVRSRTMGMQYSNELQETALLLFQQVLALGVSQLGCGFNIWDDDRKAFTSWMGGGLGENTVLPTFKAPTSEDIFLHIREAAEKGDPLFVREQSGEELEKHYRFMFSLPIWKDIMKGWTPPTFQVLHCAFFTQGFLMFISAEPVPQAHDIFKRFAKVFEQTYTRFLDLQKAEAQAKEAIKQASLDRVRGQIASMRSTEDLQRITPLIWQELKHLDIPFIRCGVFIIDEERAVVEAHLASPDGHSLGALHLDFEASEVTKNTVTNWRKKEVYHQHWNKEEFLQWAQTLVEQGQVQNQQTYQGATAPPESLDLHFVPFTQGMLYVGNVVPLTADELNLVQSLADAFAIAYARYEDFNKLEKAKESIEITLSELKATQSQLIQSEKMASLGQLTAGIAHEIQNPLNFVNNFSDVSTELVDEMNEEIDKGNLKDAKQIALDLKQNLEKINHHGKRAGDIVKGMLQHSRSSSGQKEPTDINALADEYLRLAYHGLRAKDKTFNAAMKTDYDETLGLIKVIPQDIGRVVLNLITNAFYAVSERKKQQQDKYEPVVSVSTKKFNDKIEIHVKDNGTGIPQKVLDKIFQPFFTTKPTGQGTGLGLSLSYDIIKAHGGELKAETKDGEGSTFIIEIPNNN